MTANRFLKRRSNAADRAAWESLEHLYRDGGSRDRNRLDHAARRGFLGVIGWGAVVLAVLVGVAWLGFFAFQRYAPDAVKRVVSDNGDVHLLLEAPEKVNVGDTVTYRIRYENQRKVGLKQTSVTVRYPSGFRLASAEPLPAAADEGTVQATSKEDTWNLGPLAAGGSGAITLTGQLLAPPGSNQNLWAVLYYEPENFSSQFQTEASITVTLADAPLKLEVTTPPQATATDTVELKVKYTQQGETELKGVALELVPPTSFTVQKSDPRPVSGSSTQWRIGDVAKEATGTVTITGSFAATASGRQEFTVRAFLIDEPDQPVVAETVAPMALLSGTLLTELKVNGNATDGVANFGDTLMFSLTYQNNGDEPLQDIVATVYLSSVSDFLEWTTLADRYDGTLDEFEAGRFITWTKDEVPNLGELGPGEKGVIDFSIRIVSNAGTLTGEQAVRSVATLAVATGDKPTDKVEVRSNAVTTQLNSNLTLRAAGRYFTDSGDSLGSGPIPPRVGETTHYVIDWRLTNSVHELRDVTISTTLPERVLWSGSRTVSVGGLSYDPKSRVVSWTVNRMPIGSEFTYQAQFEVSVAPAATDVGKVLALTGDIRLTGTDTVTGSPISATRGSLTTDLVDDPFAKGRGLVVE